MAEMDLSAENVSVTTGNEITEKGKLIAGILFISFTLLAILSLIAYWPDRLPKADSPGIYKCRLFNISLIDLENPPSIPGYFKEDSTRVNALTNQKLDSIEKNSGSVNDSSRQMSRRADSVRIYDSLIKLQYHKNRTTDLSNIITLNTLLLLLVAIAGFLGTMIHLASSFTNYVGAEKFKRSWLLWYIIKPFTGAGLALIIYFVFRAGLLNFNDTSNINLYGIITMAAFAGLFTDKATMKLAEIFAVVFKTNDNRLPGINQRPDRIDPAEANVKISGIKPENLVANSENRLIISGGGFDKKKLLVKIDDDEIQNPVIKTDTISLTYTIPATSDKNEFKLRVFDELGNEIYSHLLQREGQSDKMGSNSPADADSSGEAGNEEKI